MWCSRGFIADFIAEGLLPVQGETNHCLSYYHGIDLPFQMGQHDLIGNGMQDSFPKSTCPPKLKKLGAH